MCEFQCAMLCIYRRWEYVVKWALTVYSLLLFRIDRTNAEVIMQSLFKTCQGPQMHLSSKSYAALRVRVEGHAPGLTDGGDNEDDDKGVEDWEDRRSDCVYERPQVSQPAKEPKNP